MDEGFGRGFFLNITRYDEPSRSLVLSTGEHYMLNESGKMPRQQRFRSFIFEKKANNHYRIIYKSGIIETLRLRGNVHVTKTVRDSYGRGFIYTWSKNSTPPRLTKVSDINGVQLCSLVYPDDQTTTTRLYVLPSKTSSSVCYEYTFEDASRLIGMTRETDDTKEKWSFHYDWAGPGAKLHIINSVEYPSGAVESVSYYKNRFMRFPDTAGPCMAGLPCVELHVISPGAGQPAIRTRWTWTEENYLGRNAVMDKDREWLAYTDPLLHFLLPTYIYGSTATFLSASGNDALVSVTRRYNSFHLQVSETHLRDGKSSAVFVEYYARAGVIFENQPEQYLFPRSQTYVWSDDSSDPARRRTTSWKYDSEGNMLREVSPEGAVTEFVYYPAAGEAGVCPADPLGFIRYLKNKKFTPPQIKGDEPKTVSDYTWQKIAGVSKNYEVAELTASEMIGNVRVVVTRSYYDDSKGEFYGRLRTRVTTYTPDISQSESYVTSENFSYELTDAGFKKIEVVIAHDGLLITRSSLRHANRGLLLSETDALGITRTFVYDNISRLIKQTQAAGSDYERSTAWSYQMEEYGPVIIETDASGNKERVSFDGLDREIKRERFDSTLGGRWHVVSESLYNELGEAVAHTITDWLGQKDENFSVYTKDSYDGWGGLRERVNSPDTIMRQSSNPITLYKTLSVEGNFNGEKQSTAKLHIQLDDKLLMPVTQFRTPASGERSKTYEYEWDGLGRLRTKIELSSFQRKTFCTYDNVGRVLTRTLPDGTIISLTYASHLTGNQIASLKVTGLDGEGDKRTWLLGTQEFDGLGRLKSKVSGGRKTDFLYEGVSPFPSGIKLHSGTELQYSYIPEMGGVITSLKAEEIEQLFRYNIPTIQLIEAAESNSTVNYILNQSGQLQHETFSQGKINRSTTYTRTLGGGVITYKGISGDITQYVRDKYGRITSIINGTLTASLNYDGAGQLIQWEVAESTTKNKLTTSLEFDEFGQEYNRKITDSNGTVVNIKQSWTQGGQLRQRIRLDNGVETSRELFDYDICGRLSNYAIDGSNLPVDAYGNRMTLQTYSYDALNNLTVINTVLADKSRDIATYYYENLNDPTQLTSVRHTRQGYPAKIELTYDMDGRMLKDERDRLLTYDALGRLISITGAGITGCNYGYDALGRMVSQNIGSKDSRQLYYRGSEWVTEAFADKNNDVQLIKAGHTCLGVSESSSLTLVAGDGNDSLMWSRNCTGQNGQKHIWTPYGSGSAAGQLPAFNGERLDPESEDYHLGNGYRTYSPTLMRFRCPDDLSPFGAGGINPYAYCAGDPVNFTDPSGHISWQGGLSIGIGVFGLGMVLLIGGLSISVAGGLTAALEGASTAALTIGALSVVSDVTAIASGALEDSAPEASSALGWLSLGTGLAGLAGSAGRIGGQFFRRAARAPILLGGTMKNLDSLGRDVYLFDDIYKSGNRLNIVAHGALQADGTALLSRTAGAGMSADELFGILRNRVSLTDYQNIRTIMCYSGSGDTASFGQKLSTLSGLPVKSYRGSVSGNFEVNELNKLLLEATGKLGDAGMNLMQMTFAQRYFFTIHKTNPYPLLSLDHFDWAYDPVRFMPGN